MLSRHLLAWNGAVMPRASIAISNHEVHPLRKIMEQKSPRTLDPEDHVADMTTPIAYPLPFLT